MFCKLFSKTNLLLLFALSCTGFSIPGFAKEELVKVIEKNGENYSFTYYIYDSGEIDYRYTDSGGGNLLENYDSANIEAVDRVRNGQYVCYTDRKGNPGKFLYTLVDSLQECKSNEADEQTILFEVNGRSSRNRPEDLFGWCTGRPHTDRSAAYSYVFGEYEEMKEVLLENGVEEPRLIADSCGDALKCGWSTMTGPRCDSWYARTLNRVSNKVILLNGQCTLPNQKGYWSENTVREYKTLRECIRAGGETTIEK